jgi:hypothetical protein
MPFMMKYLYYWFAVGEATLPLHHLNSQFTPSKNNLKGKLDFISAN